MRHIIFRILTTLLTPLFLVLYLPIVSPYLWFSIFVCTPFVIWGYIRELKWDDNLLLGAYFPLEVLRRYIIKNQYTPEYLSLTRSAMYVYHFRVKGDYYNKYK